MIYKTAIQTILENDAAVKASVDTFTLSTNTKYMIFNGTRIPRTVPTDSGPYEPTVNNKTINHYQMDPIDGFLKAFTTKHMVACRAFKETDAETIQTAVFNALNRVKSADGKSNFLCFKRPAIPPKDGEDNYNAPVEITVRSLNC
jgi:hypothetical protein